jgi:SAM-dependent methyltransferase
MNYKHVICILCLLVITSLLGYYYKAKEEFDIVENFDSFSNYILKENPDKIYNNFYSNVYDQLFQSDTKNQFEIYNINTYTINDKTDFKKSEINFLDLGCGTGGHLDAIDKYKYSCTGVDKSMKMLEKARVNCPTASLIKGDFNNKSIFKKREFTHICCFFFTLYYSNSPDRVFKNVNYWLKPNGYFCIHLVKKDRFDPVLERASKLIPLFNPQKHTHKRVTKTKLKFNKFNYIADWDFIEDQAIFEENFLFHDNSKHIKNKHVLNIKTIKYYKKLAKKNGFKLVKIIDLLPVNHDDNYIYIFQKKYGE